VTESAAGRQVLDEFLGVNVCCLLLDVLLHSARGNVHTEKDRERFSQHTAALLSYLERPHSFGPTPASGTDNDSGWVPARRMVLAWGSS
jgi:hypothetical protein